VPRQVDDAIARSDLELRRAGVAIIRAGQAASGAYVACPSYETYRFGWLRDGSFCAAAMDVAGEPDSAAAFHAWVVRTLEAHAEKAERAIAQATLGGELPHELLLPTRYTLDGAEEPAEDDAWPNFQLDGYGTWLWAVEQHCAGILDDAFEPAVRLAARYLAATWRLPCYDCWEELGDGEHGSTLAAVTAGLDAAARLLGDAEIATQADAVRAVSATSKAEGQDFTFSTAGSKFVHLTINGQAMSAVTQHPKEAWEFLKFFNSKEADVVLMDTGIIPPRRKSSEEYYAKQVKYPPNGKVLAEMARIARMTPTVPAWADFNTILTKELAPVWTGDRRPNEALDEVVRQVNPLLKK